jgi:poly-gamma-glutamate synthesis protein (capsule biosynthesis protein)
VAWADTAEIVADVQAALDVADIVVVLLHSGVEYSPTPTGLQRAYATAAIDAGALLVLGTHSHVLQPVEEYGGGLIAYSLGNFVFDGFEGIANDTAILLVSIEGGAIAGWELVPARVVDGLPRLLD